uniref:ATP synthase complex subunit 8 n=1 Tax=Galerita orientalis TaxID=2898108 RepID=A0A976UGW7_9CARA|nr:ATP synthase F0 subunit 8 [Galerita orientalis]UVH65771.1 ATP synthase subunit 8 [Galerita orientalis]
MPQMAPMNWLSLYIMFTVIFIMFNFLNYYLYLIKNNNNNKIENFMTKILNWKW